MDRKAWIIIIICVLLIGINFYYSSENQKQQQAEAQKTAQQADADGIKNLSQASSNAKSDGNILPTGLIVPPDPVNPDIKEWDVAVNREAKGETVPVSKLKFTNFGGALRSVEMMGTPIDSRKVPDTNVTINKSLETRGIGTLVFGMGPASDPVFDETIYQCIENKNEHSITFVGRTNSGLAISKEYTLEHINDENENQLTGSDYMIRLKVKIQNELDQAIRIPDMGIFAGGAHPIAKSEQKNVFTHYFFMQNGSFEEGTPSDFKGGFFSSAKAREFVSKENITYAGVMSQYYVTAIIPDEKNKANTVFAKNQDFHLSDENDVAVPGVILALGAPVIDLQPQDTHTLEYTIYAGPKLNQVLRALPHDLDKVMAYGWFTFLSVPMNWLLNFFYNWFSNWGIAIICMTIVVRLCIWPLHKKSYMSMKRMSLVQPELKKLKEKYGNDQQKMSMEMMALYKKYSINPLSGCLPMLIQIPIFFAFYRVLQYSAELRGQSFCLWINDLSLPDTVWEMPLPFEIFSFTQLPINILPLLMAVTMIIQMKMTPQAGDKTQQRIMALMPWMFFLFCYNFASALALYWTTQNIISMGQNLIIRRLPQPELKETKGGKKKKGFFERLMEQQRTALEQQQQKARRQGKEGMRNVTPKK